MSQFAVVAADGQCFRVPTRKEADELASRIGGDVYERAVSTPSAPPSTTGTVTFPNLDSLISSPLIDTAKWATNACSCNATGCPICARTHGIFYETAINN